MHWIFMLLYIVFFIAQLFNLVLATKRKDNKYWITFFSIIIGSILSCIVMIFYSNYVISVFHDEILMILFSAIAFVLYCFTFGLGILIKVFQKYRLKSKRIKNDKTRNKTNKKMVLIPFFSVLILSILVCFVDFVVCEYKENIENERYKNVKQEKLEDMVSYINDKYNASYTVQDNVFYREYKYSEVEKNEKNHNDFYIGTFENDEEYITVSVNEDGFLSDNAQIYEIGHLIGDYYSNIVGTDIEYVEIRHKDGDCKDDLINEVLQFQFNEIITKNNIGVFIEEILKNDVEMFFYVKDNNNREALLKKIIDKLSYLEDESNISGLSIYLYDSNENLIVEKEEILLLGDYKFDEVHLNYYSSHMFGFVYVANSIEFPSAFDKANTFVTIAFSNEKYANADKYKDKNVKTIKDWTIYNFK